MQCPKCHQNTIPFFKTWLRSGLGKYRCYSCGAFSRVKKSTPLMLLTFVLGLAACAAAIYFQNWHILVIAFPILLLMEGILDFRYRKLELTDKP